MTFEKEIICHPREGGDPRNLRNVQKIVDAHLRGHDVVFLFIAAVLLFWPSMSQAGMVNYSNGRGGWQSTTCVKPIAPTYIGVGGETAASGMNSAASSYNQFVTETQKYLDCITEEARNDSRMTGEIIMMSLNAQGQDVQEEVNRVRAQLYGK